MARYNHWKTSGAPSSTDIRLGDNALCNNFLWDATDYITTVPSNCTCIGAICIANPTAAEITLRLSQTGCNYTIAKQGGGRITINQQYRDAYQLFRTEQFNYAYQKFNWIRTKVALEYPNGLPDGICKSLYKSAYWYKDISGVLAEVYCQFPFYISDREGLFEEELFAIYPNPAETAITFMCSQIMNCNYSIYSLTGEAIETNSMQSSKTIDISNYTKGMYLVLFIDAGGNVLQKSKFVVQ